MQQEGRDTCPAVGLVYRSRCSTSPRRSRASDFFAKGPGSAWRLPGARGRRRQTLYLEVRHVDAAFFLSKVGPASGPFVLARLDGARTREATDAGETLIMERVVGNRVLEDVAPNLLARPVRQRVDLDQVELF